MRTSPLYLCLRNRTSGASSLMSSTPVAARTTLLPKHRNILAFLLLIIPMFFADIGYASAQTPVHPPRVAEKAFAKTSCNWIVRQGCLEAGGYNNFGYHVFEIVRKDHEGSTIVWFDGKRYVFPYRKYRRAVVRWDIANNRATGLDLPQEYHKRYYHWWISILSEYFPWSQLLIVFILFLFCWISCKGDDPEKTNRGAGYFRLVALFWFAVILFSGGLPGHSYIGVLEKYEVLNAYLDTRRLPGGHFLPLGRLPTVRYSGWYEFLNFFYVPMFVLTHVAVLGYVLCRCGSFVRGFHYMMVPHPAAKIVKASRGDASDHKQLAAAIEASHLSTIEKPPKPFVSRNMKRKADELAALTERYAAEGQLLSTHEEFVRKEHRRKQLREER